MSTSQAAKLDGVATEDAPGRPRLLSSAGAPETSVPAVSIFHEAPELLSGLGPHARELADLRTPLVAVERGPWSPPVPRRGVESHLGMLLLDGVILRRLTLNGRAGAELLGAGDLLQPWLRQPPYDTMVAEPGWEVLDRARLAMLDGRFAAQVAPWPQIGAALVGRAVERAQRLAFHHVVSHTPGLYDRLVGLFWALADRWGRVTPDGVHLPLGLTHTTVAELVGASRPSVSTALAQLSRQGTVRRIADGWLLDMRCVEPPGASETD